MSSSSQIFSSVDNSMPSMKGILSKWTNYYYGWQDRYVCCETGSFYYYLSRDETSFGCRGTISLAKAHITVHEFDPCRFDVTVSDCTWYLRSADEAERQQWIEVIEENMLDRDSASVKSEDSFVDKDGEFKIKVTELRSFRTILSNQVDVLQRYFDACLTFSKQNGFENWTKNSNAGTPVDADTIEFFDDLQQNSFELSKFDLKREALSFKVTTLGVETTLNDFITIVNEREEMWKQKYERLQMQINSNQESLDVEEENQHLTYCGDDESEDEFYDPNNNFELISTKKHRFAEQVDEKIKEHLDDSFELPGVGSDLWELLAEDQEMKIFRKEFVKDGVVCDPLKALYVGKGVTAHELCHYFWETSSRKEWDHTIEELLTVEVIDDVTMIIHQVHKQVWPITQRDCLYISTLLKVENPPPSGNDRTPHDTWMVCNFTVEHDKVPVKPGRVRAIVEVALVCQTYIGPPTSSQTGPDEPITRDRLQCSIVYIAKIDPGGWAPPGIVRAIGKREYPKFLRNFTTFVENRVKDSDILF